MNDTLINVENISKKFCRSLKRSLWYGVQDVAGELTGRNESLSTLRKDEFWALKDVSFALRRGECLGLIGLNGAGKSTLLKILNGLIKPDSGLVTIRGRVGALIELGAGFNPILTARENIYVNGSVLGLSKAEIDRKLDSIISFAEIGDFVDTPVQNFSSGMKVRLGFSIASQLEPDVLLIDEVLAVGDANFSFKCINQINRISRSCAVVIVSHSMPMISRMSSCALSMHQGKVSYLGSDVGRAVEDYFNRVVLKRDDNERSDCFELLSVKINGELQSETDEGYSLRFNRPFRIDLKFRAKKETPYCYVNLVFMDMEGKPVAQCLSSNSDFRFEAGGGEFEISCEMDGLNLNPGRYFLHLGLVEVLPGNQLGEILYQNRFVSAIVVSDGMLSWAPVQFGARWEIRN